MTPSSKKSPVGGPRDEAARAGYQLSVHSRIFLLRGSYMEDVILPRRLVSIRNLLRSRVRTTRGYNAHSGSGPPPARPSAFGLCTPPCCSAGGSCTSRYWPQVRLVSYRQKLAGDRGGGRARKHARDQAAFVFCISPLELNPDVLVHPIVLRAPVSIGISQGATKAYSKGGWPWKRTIPRGTAGGLLA